MSTVKHLYLHLPFCAMRCSYCDFYSQERRLPLAPAYVASLLKELDEMRGRLGRLESVYLGGGTPTLVGLERLEPLLAVIAQLCRPEAEITVEANPGTVDEELACGLRRAGVTRVSLGAQSFVPSLRENLGRSGDVTAIGRAVAALRRAGIDNLSIDLIFGIPGQSREQLAYDLQKVLELAPPHISYYELTVKEGSRFQRRWARELEELERWGADFYRQVVAGLRVADYRWYETSNFARPGSECRHNLAYWRARDYIGLGASAWSTVGWQRWCNRDSIEGYIEAAAASDWQRPREMELLSPKQKLEEKLLLGLRCEEGLARLSVGEVIDWNQEEMLRSIGLISSDRQRLALADEGRYIANEVCVRLLRG